MADEIMTAAEAPAKLRQSRTDSKCSVAGCKRPYRAKTYCNVHYKLWRHGKIEGHHTRYRRCTKEGCRKPRATRGSLCNDHVQTTRAEGNS